MISNIKLTLGTQGKPYVLSANNLKTFNYIYQENISHTFSGYVTTKSGSISDYDLYVLQQLGFNVVYNEIETTAFTIYTLDEYMDEGTSIQIYNNTLEPNKVNWRIADISITSTSLPASLFDTIKERIHITNDGILVCDAPEENYSWLAEVTIEGSPNYNEGAVGSTTVYIRAVEVQDILVDTATKVLINSSNPLTVSKYPSTNTKTVGHFTVTVSKGGYTNGVYYAPPTLGNVSLLINYFLFSDSVPFKVINKTIEVTNPVITAQIVDAEGNSIDNGYIIISDGETEDVTILNGESAEVQLGKTYNITVPSLDGYDSFKAPTTVTPTKAETIVKVEYSSFPSGVLIIYEDGSYVTFDTWDFGKTNNAGSPAVAIGLKTDDVQFMFDINFNNTIKKALATNQTAGLLPSTNSLETALTYRNGQNYTNLVNSALNGDTTYMIPYCASQTLTVGGIEKNGYLMTPIEGQSIIDNKANLSAAYTVLSGKSPLIYATLWTCAAMGSQYYWSFTNNSTQIGQNNAYLNNTSTGAIPLFKL